MHQATLALEQMENLLSRCNENDLELASRHQKTRAAALQESQLSFILNITAVNHFEAEDWHSLVEFFSLERTFHQPLFSVVIQNENKIFASSFTTPT